MRNFLFISLALIGWVKVQPLDVLSGVKPNDLLIGNDGKSDLSGVEKADVGTLVHVHAVSFQ